MQVKIQSWCLLSRLMTSIGPPRSPAYAPGRPAHVRYDHLPLVRVAHDAAPPLAMKPRRQRADDGVDLVLGGARMVQAGDVTPKRIVNATTSVSRLLLLPGQPHE